MLGQMPMFSAAYKQQKCHAQPFELLVGLMDRSLHCPLHDPITNSESLAAAPRVLGYSISFTPPQSAYAGLIITPVSDQVTSCCVPCSNAALIGLVCTCQRNCRVSRSRFWQLSTAPLSSYASSRMYTARDGHWLGVGCCLSCFLQSVCRRYPPCISKLLWYIHEL